MTLTAQGAQKEGYAAQIQEGQGSVNIAGEAACPRTASVGPAPFLGEIDPAEFQRALLEGKEPRGDGHDE